MDLKSLIHTDALQDKSLWLAIAGPLVILVSNLVGHPVDSHTADLIVGGIVTFIVSSKAKQAYVAGSAVKGLDPSLALLETAGAKPVVEDPKGA